jgi:hypothetical protein
MAEMYSEASLRRLLALAIQLQFWDDVLHWKSELKRRGFDA